jgi:hypothetical protein
MLLCLAYESIFRELPGNVLDYLKYYGVFSVTCYVITGTRVEFIQLLLNQAIIFNTNVHHVAAIHYA